MKVGQGTLTIWNDVAPGRDDEFNRWHLGEHMAERVGVPGFLRGRRYDVLRGARRYFTLYETERPEVLGGPDYVARLQNPTPMTQKCIPLFRNNMRTACRVTATLGHGVGGVVVTLNLGPTDGRDEALRGWLSTRALPALLDAEGIVAAHLLEANVEITHVRAREKKLLDRPDDVARWIVVVEGTSVDRVDAACAARLDPAELAEHGADANTALATYRLVYALARGD